MAATLIDLLTLDNIWDKLVQIAGYRAGPKLSSLVTVQQPSNGLLNVYVSNSGADTNPGTLDAPFATIQKAISSVVTNPTLFKSRIMINVAAGNYAGAIIDAVTTLIPDDPTTQYSGLEIRGTLANVVPAGGTGSGTITSYTAASGSAAPIMTDSGQAWVTNELKDKLLVLTSGTGFPGTELAPPIFPILSNTATSITFRGPDTAVGAHYQIMDSATIINAPWGVPAASSGSIPGVTLSKAAFMMGANQGGSIGFSRLKFSMGTALQSCISGNGMSGWRMVACQVVSATGQGVTSIINAANLQQGRLDGGTVSLIQCSIQVPNNCTGIAFGGNSSTQHNVTNCVIRGVSGTSSSGINLSADGKALISGSSLVGLSVGIGYSRGHTGGMIFNTSTIDGTGGTGPIGLNMVPIGTNLAMPGGSWNFSNVDVSNCTTAIVMQGRNSLGWLVTCTGTGNTTAVKLNEGAALKVGSGVSLTGTSEIVLDGGSALLLSDMRAASPKLFTNTYGSLIYQ